MNNIKMNFFSLFFSLLLLTFGLIQGCKKDGSETAEPERDKLTTKAQVDSNGNSYYAVVTKENQLELRVKDAAGNIIFSEGFPAIDSTEIPISADSIWIALYPPNRSTSNTDATISLVLVKQINSAPRQYVQLLGNVDIERKTWYTKKFKVDKPTDWSFVEYNNAVVPWYQNTILVREGTDGSIRGGGGFMGLGSRGTLLVCYERDFKIRYTKDIDANAAYYPQAGGTFIPVSETDRIAFGLDTGLLARYRIVVSIEEEWAGLKPTVWELDLKRIHNLPSDYSIKITEYEVNATMVTTSYTIYNAAGETTQTLTRDWDINTGAPRTQLNP